MLYQLYEAQRSMMEPFSDLAKVASKVYSNPLSTLGQVPFRSERLRHSIWCIACCATTNDRSSAFAPSTSVALPWRSMSGWKSPSAVLRIATIQAFQR